MGMFDDMRCLYQLPDLPDNHTRAFQTKSLGCMLDMYVITPDGTLVRGTQSGENWERVDTNEPMDDFTGPVEFYDDHTEYLAVFRKGRMVMVMRTDVDSDPVYLK